MLYKKLFILCMDLLFCGSVLQAQTLTQAKQMYNEGKFAEAKPVFERLVKQVPSNASYNHWYGVCCYETGELEKAIKPLSFAVKRKVQEAYRYLGEVYFLTYRFPEAVDMYEQYIEILTKRKKDTSAAERRLNVLENAARLVDKVEDIQVIDSVVVDKKDFLSAYTLSEECGSLFTTRDFFGNSGTDSTSLYLNQKGDKVYYSQNAGENHLCLFTQSRLLDSWGDEKQLPMSVNSPSDDNYPFVLSDGVTMYYSSKKEESLGGYDLFITRYNMETDTYLAPEQMGMPFNSPYNDYMMVIDEVKGLGWFVSDRFQPEGKVCVYLFIPEADRKRVVTEDSDLKRRRAAIFSIQESWRNENYEDLIKLSHEIIPFGKKKEKHDFEFVINDNLVYYKLDQIQSKEAKAIYQKSLAAQKQLTEISAKLEELRAQYIVAKGNAAARDKLGTSILSLEEQYEQIQLKPAELEKNARNEELKFLKKKL